MSSENLHKLPPVGLHRTVQRRAAVGRKRINVSTMPYQVFTDIDMPSAAGDVEWCVAARYVPDTYVTTVSMR